MRKRQACWICSLPNDLIQTLLHHSLSYLCMTLSSLNSALCFTQEKRRAPEEDKKKSLRKREADKKSTISTKGCLALLRTACVFFVCIARPTSSREREKKAEIVKRKLASTYTHTLFTVLKLPVTLYYTTHAAKHIKVKCPTCMNFA